MSTVLYLETSAALRAVLEAGTTPDIEHAIAGARHLITSRLTLVEAGRAVLRLRVEGQVDEVRLADAGRALDSLWQRCAVWEITPQVCDLATQVAPTRSLRTLDALHLATFLLARQRLGEVVLVSADRRLLEAAGTG